MDRGFLNEHLQEIAVRFFEKKQLNSEEYHISISKKGNLMVTNLKSKEVFVFQVLVTPNGSYSFKNIGGNTITGSKKSTKKAAKKALLDEENQMFRQHIPEMSDIAQKIFSYYWSFISSNAEVTKLTTNKNFCSVTVKFAYEDITISTNSQKYRDASFTQKECLNRFLELYEAELINYAKNNIPCGIIKRLKNSLSGKMFSEKAFGTRAEKLRLVIENYSREDRLFVMGKKTITKLTTLCNKIFRNELKIKYDPDKKLFIVSSGFSSVTITPDVYAVSKIQNNTAEINKIKKALEDIAPKLEYFSFVLGYVRKIKELDCEFPPCDKNFNGICFEDASVKFLYTCNAFSIQFSIPHLPFSEEKNITEIKKEARVSLEKILKEIKKKMEEIKEKRGKTCRENKKLYQSYAAQTIYDFLKEEESLCSVSRIADYLVSGTTNGYPVSSKSRKYKESLSNYPKTEVKEFVTEMYKDGLLVSYSRKGTYGSFDVYTVNKYNWDYPLYFNQDTRNQKEVMRDLRDGVILSPCDSLLVLETMREGKIKDRDLLCAFTLFKNHEFVLNNKEKIEEAFLNLPENIKLYIPFVIDDYKKTSVERKILRNIERK